MPTLASPLRFEPFLRPVVWGGRRLATLLGKHLPFQENYGESWEISDHPSHRTRVAEGPLAGLDLRGLMERHGVDLLGRSVPSTTVFPWLVKFLDARDWLSIQVHPDDAAAQRLWPGEGGKTEAWFILDAAPGSRIWAGLKAGVNPPRLKKALQDGTVVDCLHSFTPRPGQCVFLPAGTIHAVGGGVLLAEIQQTSDATFRLFDWNRTDAHGRPRTLHIEQGLAAIDWARGPVEPVEATGFPGLDEARWPGPVPDSSTPLVRCPYFDLDYVQGAMDLVLKTSGTFMALIVLAGSGRFSTGEACSKGQTWLLPASLGAVTLHADRNGLCALTATLP